MVEYEIRDPAKAPEGERKIAWVARRMPVLNRLREEYGGEKPLAGTRLPPVFTWRRKPLTWP